MAFSAPEISPRASFASSRERAPKKSRAANARSREEAKLARGEISDAEKAMARLQAQASAVDQAMSDPASASADLAALTMGDLAKRRAELTRELEEAEQRWLLASERLEQQFA